MEIDERFMDVSSGLRAVMDMDAKGRVITVTLWLGGTDFAGLRTEDRAKALEAYHHPFSVIPGAADTLRDLQNGHEDDAAPAAAEEDGA